MINDKISKLISELDTSVGMLIVASANNRTVYDAMEKVSGVSFELGNLIDDIEKEKAIDRCKVRQLAINEEIGDCGVDENGKCIGYANDGGEPYDECEMCIYGVYFEEDK